MAILTKIKRSNTPGSTPSSLSEGELAVNIPDKALWVGNSTSGAVNLFAGNGASSPISSIKLNVNTSATLIDTSNASNFIGNEYLAVCVDNVNANRNKISKLNLIANSSDVSFTEYGIIKTNDSFEVATFTSNLSSENIRLYATGDSSNVSISLIKTSLGNSSSNGSIAQFFAAASGGGSPNGSNTEIQFNDSSSFGGSAGFTFNKTTNVIFVSNTITVGSNVFINTSSIVVGNSTVNSMLFDSMLNIGSNGAIAPPTPAANSLNFFSDFKASRMMPTVIGATGWIMPFQPHLGHNSMYWVMARPTATTIDLFRMTTANTLATVARTPAIGNLFLSQTRLGISSNTTAGTSAGLRNSVGLPWWRGNAADQGGFYAVTQFGISIVAAQGRAFVGFKDSTTGLANANPSAQTNIIGFGFDSAQKTLRAISANSTVANTIDLGTGFAVDVGNTNWFECIIYARPNGDTVSYQVTNLTDGNTVFGDYNQTNLPSNTTFLTWQFWVNNGSTAAAQALDFKGVTIETLN